VITKDEAAEIIRKYKRFGGRAKMVKILLESMDGRKVYSLDDLYLIGIQHGYRPSSVNVALPFVVRDGYAERVSHGKYRKLKNYVG
jgi:hypothetical protein